MSHCKFFVVDVFAHEAFKGNPVMIVDATGDIACDIDTQRMQSFASWNGMPETVFLTRAPHDAPEDYVARIFSPRAELGFAGHPSLGAAHIAHELGWIGAAASTPARAPFGMSADRTIAMTQRCNAGLVEAKMIVSGDAGTRAYVKTPTAAVVRPLTLELADRTSAALRSAVATQACHVYAGANWIVVKFDSLAALHALEPDMTAIEALGALTATSGVTAYAPTPHGTPERFEVRSFGPGIGVPEDAICGGGSLCVAALESRLAPERHDCGDFETRQGYFIGRNGRARLIGPVDDARFWVGGTTRTMLRGTVDL